MVDAHSKYWLCTTVIVLLGYSALGSINPYIYPPGEEIVINSGENITLKCFGTKPVHWSNKTSSSVEGKSVDGKKYIAILQINNAEYFETGYYVCNMSDSGNDVYHSRIYLYVRDPVHLLVYEDFLQLYGEQYGTVVFPCRPTAPDITVTLTKDGEEVTPAKVNEDGVDMSYNPRDGFTLSNINNKDQGSYDCEAKHDDKTSSLSLYLSIFSHTDSIPKPYLNITDVTHLEEGANITILCRVEVQPGSQFDIKWLYPAKKQGHLKIGHIKETNVLVGDIVNVNNKPMKEGRTTLVITNITKEDSGVYACTVEDHNRNVNRNEKVISVFSAPSVEIVSNELEEYHIRHALFTVKCRVQGYPQPDVSWLYRGFDRFQDYSTMKYEKLSKSNYSNVREGKYIVSTASVTALKNGQIMCLAYNTILSANKTINFTVTDIKNGDVIHLSGITTQNEEETSSIYCMASKSKYTDPFKWMSKNENKNENFSDDVFRQVHSHFGIQPTSSDSAKKRYNKQETIDQILGGM